MAAGRILCALVCIVLGGPCLNAAVCPGEPTQYLGYTVTQVRIDSPLRFVTAATFDFDTIKSNLALLPAPIRDGMKFDIRTVSLGLGAIREAIVARSADSPQKFKIVAVVYRPENCDTTARTLDVVYRVFTLVAVPSFSRTFESRASSSEQPASTAAREGTESRYMLLPTAGYNHTRRGYGGLKASASAPLGLFHKLDFASSFSTAATEVHLDLAGSASPSSAALQHAEWRLGFHYTDLPAGTAKLKEAKLAAQFSAATRELSEGGAVLRYGLAFEGGHQQTGGFTPFTAPNSSYGDLKLYTGITRSWDRMALTGSYGGQLATTLTGGGLDFSKHIIDLGYWLRFIRTPKTEEQKLQELGSLHKPLDIQTRFTAGLIEGSGFIPAAERFFGGNQVHPFIAGDDWIINSDAFIRSIPENRLAALTLGGTRFYSGNITVSKVLGIGRPLLPKEVATKDFLQAVNFGLNSAEGKLEDAYKAKDPTFQLASTAISDLESTAASLKKVVDAVPRTAPFDAPLKPVRSDAILLVVSVSALKKGDPSVAGRITTSQIPAFDSHLGALIAALSGAGQADLAKQLEALRTELLSRGKALTEAIRAVNTTRPKELAQKDLSVARRVLDTIMYEVNVYSVAPVAIFDVARVWPAGAGIRYAAGGGVRFSLVNLNLTIGYAANPSRRSGEGPGALFVTLDVLNLFH